MISNSKLDALQKADRKTMLANLPKCSSIVSCENMTILAVPDGSVTRIFSSVMSEDEQKFRRKVGEFHALMRFDRDPEGGMLLPGIWTAHEVLEVFSR